MFTHDGGNEIAFQQYYDETKLQRAHGKIAAAEPMPYVATAPKSIAPARRLLGDERAGANRCA